MRTTSFFFVLVVFFFAASMAACGASDGERVASEQSDESADSQDDLERSLALNLGHLQAYADSIEAALRPVPLLRPNETSAFVRYRNADQLAAARRLGISQPVTEEAVRRHIEEGRLVQLGETEYWTLRETEYGTPLGTPDLVALLQEIGERFHERLAEMDVPPLRLEVTSVLRTAADQAELRSVNPNAAIGESTHQYGTTVDITYASFRAPLEPEIELTVDAAPWLEPHLRRVEAMAAETGAARMSRELQAILGRVLREMQNEGKVMVTLEVLQPVYHMTVAQRLAS